MTALGQDLRHGARLLLKSPGFALAAIGVLTLGIGANTAIFSVVNAVLLQPLPFPDSARLVRVWHTPPAASFPGMRIFAVSPANYLDWESQNHVFEKTALIQFQGLNLTGGGEPESVAAAQVSSDFFPVLGARPALGRTFTREESSGGPSRVVVLGHSIWKTRFGADPGIVGREIRLDDQPWRVVGVMGPDIRLPDFSSIWIPMEWDAKKRAQRNNHNCMVVARLKPGIGLKQAQAEMNVLSGQLARQYPEDDAGWGAVVVPLREDLVANVRPALLILLRRRRLRAPDRVRQCRQSRAGQDARAAQGDRRPQRARREPRPPAAAVARRDPPPLARGRRPGSLPRELRRGRHRRLPGGPAPALGGSPPGRVGPGVHPGGLRRHGSRLPESFPRGA